MDLLHEVRQFSRHLQQCARASALARGQQSYTDALQALIDSRIRASDPHLRIVCYASAAELGIPVELQVEHCKQAMAGGLGFPLRVLFWAAHRRMQSARQARHRGGMPEPVYLCSPKP